MKQRRISQKQHPILSDAALIALEAYRTREAKRQGVTKISINDAISSLIVFGERATRDAAQQETKA